MPSPTLALLLALAFQPAQLPPDTLVHLPVLGGPSEDRLRIEQLQGDRATGGFLLRSPSTLLARSGPGPDSGRPLRLTTRWLAPELRTVWNSELPFSLNEGPLWAGRGVSGRLTGGVHARWRALTLILAPQLVAWENADFQTTSYPEPDGERIRHRYASPFHYPPHSVDLPQRPGEAGGFAVDPGQSSLTVRFDRVAFGLATENLWWGPGVRNSLLMSAQAPGIPHLFVETPRAVQTPLGALRARWVLGRLTESEYFDFDPANDHRSLSGLVLEFTPSFDPGLSLGVARSVVAPSGSLPVDAALDVFRNVGRPAQQPGDTLLAPGPDQLFSVFARWVFPSVGFEVYGEWGRQEQPASLRDFLQLPQHSRAYTVGLQYVRSAGEGKLLRLQSEITSLEPSQSFRVREIGEWYASRRVPQGYTHRGRVIGAAIGPSGSSQWAALDWRAQDWSMGTFVGRIRWENEALYSYFDEFRRPDLSLLPGVRGSLALGPLVLHGSYTYGVRLNYLFQAWPLSETRYRGVDLTNHTLALTLSTRRP
jgi:hypothetical protein